MCRSTERKRNRRNCLAGNRLILTQVEEVYKKGNVSVGFEPIKVDDIIEAYNHFDCVIHIIDTAANRIFQSYASSTPRPATVP